MRPTARFLSDGERLHLQHGPSDLIIWAEGARHQAYQAAIERFETIIAEIVEELLQLRKRHTFQCERPMGEVARRMHDACVPYASEAYVTRMAAVAGSVADEVLAAMTERAGTRRAYVNNGGDIALYLAEGSSFRTAITGHDGTELGRIEIEARDRVGGITTSGRHGRSLSLGIADSVTVLARTAAEADVAATLIANAVDLPGHPAVIRRPACEVADDSDLGNLAVTVGCGPLSAEDCDQALTSGYIRAEAFRARKRIMGAALFLQGHAATTGGHFARFEIGTGHAAA